MHKLNGRVKEPKKNQKRRAQSFIFTQLANESYFLMYNLKIQKTMKRCCCCNGNVVSGKLCWIS